MQQLAKDTLYPVAGVVAAVATQMLSFVDALTITVRVWGLIAGSLLTTTLFVISLLNLERRWRARNKHWRYVGPKREEPVNNVEE